MQTLGLASEQKPTDGMLKRLFWPTIENQYDVDLVGVQGFWVCCGVGVVTFLVSLPTHHAVFGVFALATYFLAGVGVRERSVAAAVLILLCYTLDKIATFFILPIPGPGLLVSAAIIMLLAANVRGTMLARRWRVQAAAAGFAEDADGMVERTTGTAADRFANVLPAKVWPRGRFVFYPLAGLLLAATLLGILMFPFVQREEKRRTHEQQQDSLQ